MDIIRSPAKILHEHLQEWAVLKHKAVPQKSEIEHLYSAKSDIFNACTVALIASVALALIGAIPIASCIILGGTSIFGRYVVEESFNEFLPSGVKYVAPNLFKPPTLVARVTCYSTVIFY